MFLLFLKFSPQYKTFTFFQGRKSVWQLKATTRITTNGAQQKSTHPPAAN